MNSKNISIKDELNAEIATDHRHRRHIIIALLLIFVCITLLGLYTTYYLYNSHKDIETNQTIDETPAIENEIDNKPSSEITNTQIPSADNTQTTQVQPDSQQPYIAPVISIDRDDFISDSNKTMDNYSQIVDLLNFGSISDSEKTNRIKQAIALDRQYFSQVTDLRANLVWANVSDGPYMEAVELEESGVSKISVGLTFMNYWADNHSRVDDYNIGLGDVGVGAKILLEFSDKLNSL